MTPRSDRYRAARAQAAQARARLNADLALARFRFSPASLKKEASEKVKAKAIETRAQATQAARDHPFIVAGASTGVLALIFRKPLTALLKRLSVVIRNRTGRSQEGDDHGN